MTKVIVEVYAKFDINGNVLPELVIWEDGRKFEVDKVLDMRRAASLKGGGIGIRYTVKILGKETYLWRDGTQWFVEAKQKIPL